MTSKEKCAADSEGAIEYQNATTRNIEQDFLSQFINGVQLEQELYLQKHPDVSNALYTIIRQMLTQFMAKMMHQQPQPMEALKIAALYFTKPNIGIGKKEKKIPEMAAFKVKVSNFTKEFKTHLLNQDKNKGKLSEGEMAMVTPGTSTSNTDTSSFMSILTSESTFINSEISQSLELSSSEIFSYEILKLIDKAVYFHVTDEDIMYDIAYVEIMKAVEEAMEIPVVQIRADVIDFLNMAFYLFELQIEEKKRIAAQQNAWETRLRKKLRKKLRQRFNYRGYERQQVTENEILPEGDSAECRTSLSKCLYNRYPKDRFGVYLPQNTAFSNESVTVPVTIDETIEQNEHNYETETTSLISGFTNKSGFMLTKSLDSDKLGIIFKYRTRQSNKLNVAPNMTSANIILYRPRLKLFWKG